MDILKINEDDLVVGQDKYEPKCSAVGFKRGVLEKMYKADVVLYYRPDWLIYVMKSRYMELKHGVFKLSQVEDKLKLVEHRLRVEKLFRVQML